MIKVGKIINTRGLKGECKLFLVTDDPDHRFKKGQKLYVDSKIEVKVLSFSMHKGFGYVKFEEIDTIEKAEAFKGYDLMIKKEDLPALENGQHYYFELMDCAVFNEKKEELGVVSDIIETGVHPVLRISKGNQSFLCPYNSVFVESVNVETKEMIIKEMEGLR